MKRLRTVEGLLNTVSYACLSLVIHGVVPQSAAADVEIKNLRFPVEVPDHATPECTFETWSLEGGRIAFNTNEDDGDGANVVLKVHDVKQQTTIDLEPPGRFRLFVGNQVAWDSFPLPQIPQTVFLYDLEEQVKTQLSAPSGPGNACGVDASENDLSAHQLNGDLLAVNGWEGNSDVKLVVHDLRTATQRTLASARSIWDVGFDLEGVLVAFTTTTDRLQHSLQVYDSRTGNITAPWITTSSNFWHDFDMWGEQVAFSVSESADGGTDLNGDGDAEDDVLHLYDANSRNVLNLGLAIGYGGLEMCSDTRLRHIRFAHDLIVFCVDEEAQGGTDLNSDGDSSDTVLHVYDARTQRTTNLSVAAFAGGCLGGNYAIDEDLVVFEAREYDPWGGAGVDLNGDGDTVDGVIHIYDARVGKITNLGFAVAWIATKPAFQIDERRVIFAVSEEQQGPKDLNGDGDTEDAVLHFHDTLTGSTANLGVAGFGDFQLEDDILAFTLWESIQGVDLNGDGDTSDLVLHAAIIAESETLRFVRGDCNDDGNVDISDAVCILSWLFLGQAEPGCKAATNIDGVGEVDITDPIYLLTHLFLGGPALVEPFPGCGIGTLPTDQSTCEAPPIRCQQ